MTEKLIPLTEEEKRRLIEAYDQAGIEQEDHGLQHTFISISPNSREAIKNASDQLRKNS